VGCDKLKYFVLGRVKVAQARPMTAARDNGPKLAPATQPGGSQPGQVLIINQEGWNQP